MEIEYVGGPADGRTEPAPPGPLPDYLIVPRKPVLRFAKPEEPDVLPQTRREWDYIYRLRDVIGGVASYVLDGKP